MAAAGDRLTIEQWLDSRPIGGVQWLVLIVTSAIMLADGFDLQALALAIPALSRDWGVGPERLSWALSISLIGMGVGAAVFGMVGDRYGRKTLIWTSLLAAGGSCAATALATAPGHVVALRLLTGLGIGAANINALALTTEYSPPRRRFLFMMVMGCNMASGGALAGLAAPPLIAAFGWHGIFVAGGLFAIAVGLVVLAIVPESLSHTAAHGGGARLARLAAQLDPKLDSRRLAPAPATGRGRFPLAALLAPELRLRTLTLWLVYVIGSFTLYLMVSWLPVLLVRAGWPEADALRGTVTLQLGGIVGSIIAALCIDRGHLVGTMIAGYALTAVGLLLLLAVPASILVWSVLIFVIGFGVSGNQLILLGAASALYPERLRATSAGAATAVARIGAISAPLAGGMLLAAGIPPSTIMASLALPMLLQIAMLAATRTQFQLPRRRPG